MEFRTRCRHVLPAQISGRNRHFAETAQYPLLGQLRRRSCRPECCSCCARDSHAGKIRHDAVEINDPRNALDKDSSPAILQESRNISPDLLGLPQYFRFCLFGVDACRVFQHRCICPWSHCRLFPFASHQKLCLLCNGFATPKRIFGTLARGVVLGTRERHQKAQKTLHRTTDGRTRGGSNHSIGSRTDSRKRYGHGRALRRKRKPGSRHPLPPGRNCRSHEKVPPCQALSKGIDSLQTHLSGRRCSRFSANERFCHDATRGCVGGTTVGA
mmetsp:Transcript_14746/g.37087  ORF Transcript_14746/g.37087 Transcript_14746/m.37087 type:complete len:271 (+) Transcript_14746:630-1442(+)